MLRLLIQTVLNRCEVALLSESALLAVDSWESAKDEVKRVLPAIETLLKEENFQWKDIEEIIVVVGKGNFSATRIGVTMANIISLTTGAKIYEMQVDQEKDLKEMIDEINKHFKKGWNAVELAKPIYRSEPMISPSKKKKFTE